MLAYVKNATVKDLNIYGEEINGYGLVDGLHGVGFTSEDTFAIIIENVTLKSGTKTLKSGLIGAEVDMDVNGFAGASAAFITTIRNCTIEKMSLSVMTALKARLAHLPVDSRASSKIVSAMPLSKVWIM